MNTKLLLKVKEHILEEPKRANMDRWLVKKAESPEDFKALARYGSGAPACGTIGCIAGWTVVLKRKNVAADEIEFEARELLGLSWDEQERLFVPSAWPEKYSARLDETKAGTKMHARVIAQRIDFFIKTKGTDSVD